MKKVLFSIIVLVSIMPVTIMAATNIIPDENFRKAVIENNYVDTNNDGIITITEANAFRDSLLLEKANITSIEGIQYFKNANNINISKNNISDITPLEGLVGKNVGSIAVSNNVINSSILRSFDTQAGNILDALEASGIVIPERELQRITYDKTRITSSVPVYKVLFVIVNEIDTTVELTDGSFINHKYKLTDLDKKIIREYARLFEMDVEKITDYQINIEYEIYETKNTITDLGDYGLSAAMTHDYDLFGSKIEEIRDIIPLFDTTIVYAGFDERMHSYSGLATFDAQEGIKRGMAFIPYDSVIYSRVLNDEPIEDLYNELRNNYCDTFSIVVLHEFIHTLEMYSKVRGHNIWEFHNAIIQGDTNYPFEIKARYLLGQQNPRDNEESGIPSFVYTSSPTKYYNDTFKNFIIDGIKYTPISSSEVKAVEIIDKLANNIAIPNTITYNSVTYKVTTLQDGILNGTNINNITIPINTININNLKTNYESSFIISGAIGSEAFKFAFANALTFNPLSIITPTNFSAKSEDYNKIKLTWDFIIPNGNYAISYDIYQATSQAGTYTKIANTTNNYAYVSSLTTDKTYYYKIKAVVSLPNKNVYSDYTSVKSICPKLKNLSFTGSQYGSDKIKLTWNKVNGATGYKIYRYNSKTGIYSFLKTITSGSITSYIDVSLTSNKNYYYKIKAYRTISKTTYYSDISNKLIIKTSPAIPKISVSSSGTTTIKISITPVTGANGYEIYRASSKTGTYYLIATTTNLTYYNTNRTTNKTYYYKVRAYRVNGNAKIRSSFCSIYSAKSIPSTPSITLSSTKKKYIKVSWKEVKEVSGYAIYRATSKSGTYKKISTVSSRTTHINNYCTSGKRYYYKVKAYKIVNKTRVYSNYSTIKTTRCA